MKNSLPALSMVGKSFLYGFLFQLLFLNFMYASPTNGQSLWDIGEVYWSQNLGGSSLTESFNTITSQTYFSVIYDRDFVEQSSSVTHQKEPRRLGNMLSSLDNSDKLDTRISVKKSEENGEEKWIVVEVTVSGTVTDGEGQPIPGATVLVQGTSIGTATNLEGRYSISVPEGTTLVFSFIGYETQQILIGDRSMIDVTLSEDMTSLDEVVVVGFGTQTKATSVSAVSTISSAEIIKAPVGDVTNALTGRMAGVMTRQLQGRPGASEAQIYIRGRASNNSAALIIVDGVERESFGDIDASDIESISVLKDAGSTALFGLKGANGVIVVTTKRGIKGAARITYTAQFGLNTFGQRPKPLRSYQAAVLQNEGEDNMLAAGILDPDTYKKFFTTEDIEMFRTGTGDPLLYPDVDWFEELTQKTWGRQQHNLSLRGGSEKVNYFVSLGYMHEDGMFKHFDTPLGYKTSPYAKRINFRSNLDYKLTPTTTVSLNLSGRIENEHTVRGIKYTQTAAVANFLTGSEAAFKWMYIAPSWSMPFDREAAQRATPEAIALDDTYNQIIGVGFGEYQENPYINLKRGGFTDGENNVLGSVFAIDQKLDFITEGLSLIARIAYDQSSAFYRNQSASGAVYTVNRDTKEIIPAYENPANYRIDDPLNSNTGVGGGLLKTNVQIQANINKTYGEHHASGALVATRELKHLTGIEAPSAFQGMVFRTTYNFKDKYYSEFNGSYQGSENFDAGYRYGFFPTVGLGYTLSKENFMTGINKSIGLEYLKIRGSIGSVGYSTTNISLVGYRKIDSRFLFLDEYGPTGGFTLGNPTRSVSTPGYYHKRIGNPFATFERGFKRNIGIDANFLENRVQIVVDLFDERRTGILLSRGKATFEHYGEDVPIYNYGENYNGGVEVEVRLTNRTGPFVYGANIQFSHIKNKRVILDEPLNQRGNLRKAGSAIGQFWSYDVADGFFQNQAEIDAWAKMEGFPFMPGDIKLMDVNGDGLITAEDYTSIGYSDVPIDQYSLAPHISYKRFSLSALFQAVDKVSNEFYPVETDAIFIVPQYYEFQLDRWTPETPNASYPAIRAANIGQNRFFGRTDLAGEHTGIINAFNLQDASYIKLRNISLMYAIPQKWTSKLKLHEANVSLTGNNLFTWTNYIGLDPENGDDLNVGTYVNRGVTYPNIRTYQLNISITL